MKGKSNAQAPRSSSSSRTQQGLARAERPAREGSSQGLEASPLSAETRAALDFIAARYSDDRVDWKRIEPVLRQRYAALAAWPADAQLALYVLGWMLGPGFQVRAFTASVNRFVPDFRAAATAVEGGGRDATEVAVRGAVAQALRNAAVVLRWNLDGALLYWPAELSDNVGGSML